MTSRGTKARFDERSIKRAQVGTSPRTKGHHLLDACKVLLVQIQRFLRQLAALDELPPPIQELGDEVGRPILLPTMGSDYAGRLCTS